MPPRWPRQPTRQDPSYRKLDDRMNFAVHVAIFAATNSGIWFVRTLQSASWTWPVWFTGAWAIALVVHAIFIFTIADYSDDQSPSSSQNG